MIAAEARRSAAYEGVVFHKRLRPKAHAFRYRVFSLLVDLDELPDLDRGLRLFSRNRWNLFSFRDRDHGTGDPQTLAGWVHAQLRTIGVAIQRRLALLQLLGGGVRRCTAGVRFGLPFRSIACFLFFLLRVFLLDFPSFAVLSLVHGDITGIVRQG